ncbi:ROK family protein [Adhaeribacter radiodurans]|uniref:ROK family protein n=1 Tax=Adhaeribacter radiodurans TaxID=2745197 RepID=A0A7L7LBC3_9BACT|nr:ROK family protein [Adhaeribacter radiodurans]QMU30014.1 ROK family protein [Adhaeribacter radiodurans]
MSALFSEDTYLDTLNHIERKKHLQKLKIIKFLYVKGAKTNAAICERFTISAPTSMALLNELIAEGIVEKQGRGLSIGGRKPDLYGLQENSLFVLSIEMEKHKTRMAIFNNKDKNITGIRTFPLQITQDLTAVDQLYICAEELIQTAGIDKNKLIGIGISMPGLVASKEGNTYTYLLTNNSSESLEEILEKKFNKPVFIQNDVKTISLAEYRFGLAHGKKDVLVVWMDWGIGLGMIMDGKLRSGTSGFAGEFGHIPIIDDGLLCQCGKRGCLETVASGMALVRLAKEGIKGGAVSMLSELTVQEIEQLEPPAIIEAANRGDQFAIRILSEVGMHLGKGLAILIQLFNPELIILSGTIAEARQYITTPVQQSLNTYCMAQLREKTSIALSDLGNNTLMLGSLALVMENIFENNIGFAKNKGV